MYQLAIRIMDEQRKALRNAAITQREALTDDAREQANIAILDALGPLLSQHAPRVLGFCWPYRGEPDLTGFIAGWLMIDPARRAALPVVIAPGAPMIFREWTTGSEMIPDRHGIPMPATGDTLVPDVILVPLNAFDSAGYRLGYGGGYFDRTLASLTPPPITIGIGYEVGRVDTTHPQPHDHPMDWIVTEAGIQHTAGAR